MTQKEKHILKLLKSYLDGEIDFHNLDDKWIEIYIEDEDDTQYIFEKSFYEIAEFIYWGTDSEPSQKEKSHGVLGPKQLKNKIREELNKHPNWEKLSTINTP